ncbi:MAG: hypothetical protein HYU52_11690 [Acidobacteria bacterium]|nr:hypothetical protein [Acidobacteriota bacterium]
MGNAQQKARIEAMKREIERRGGFVGSLSPISDDLLEIFLRDVLGCPDCAAGADDPFAPRRRGKHAH